jgi:hypothetical protein
MSNTSDRWKSQGGINRRPANNILNNNKQSINTLTITQQLGISNNTIVNGDLELDAGGGGSIIFQDGTIQTTAASGSGTTATLGAVLAAGNNANQFGITNLALISVENPLVGTTPQSAVLNADQLQISYVDASYSNSILEVVPTNNEFPSTTWYGEDKATGLINTTVITPNQIKYIGATSYLINSLVSGLQLNASSSAWTFLTNGSIIFPDGTIQTTAGGGGNLTASPFVYLITIPAPTYSIRQNLAQITFTTTTDRISQFRYTLNVSNSQLSGGVTPSPDVFTSAETGSFYISFARANNGQPGTFNRNSNNTAGLFGTWTGCLFYNIQRTSATAGTSTYPNITNASLLYTEYNGTNIVTLYAVSSDTDWDTGGGGNIAPVNVNYSFNIEVLNDGGIDASIGVNTSVVNPFTFTPV